MRSISEPSATTILSYRASSSKDDSMCALLPHSLDVLTFVWQTQTLRCRAVIKFVLIPWSCFVIQKHIFYCEFKYFLLLYLNESCNFWTEILCIYANSSILSGGYKVMSSTLADQWRPRMWAQMRGRGVVAESQPMSTAVHRNQKYLGDLTPYLKVHKNENFFGFDFDICTFS